MMERLRWHSGRGCVALCCRASAVLSYAVASSASHTASIHQDIALLHSSYQATVLQSPHTTGVEMATARANRAPCNPCTRDSPSALPTRRGTACGFFAASALLGTTACSSVGTNRLVQHCNMVEA